MKHYDLIIIGAGASGMLTAIACKENGMNDILVIDKAADKGGALASGDYKIFKSSDQTGMEYLKELTKTYDKAGIDTLLETMVLNINDNGNVVCVNSRDGVVEYQCDNVLIANGGKEKGRTPLTMTGDRVAGTFSLATAKVIANSPDIILGTNIAIFGTEHLDSIEQTFLKQGISVTTIINPTSRSFSCAAAPEVTVYDGYELSQLLGDGRLEKVILKKEGSSVEVPCDTLIFAHGWLSDGIVPMRSGIALNPETTGAKVNACYETNRPNIYASGNAIFIHKYMEDIIEEAGKVAECICNKKEPLI